MKTKLSTLVLSAAVVGAALLIVPSFTSDGGGGGSQAAIEKSPSGEAQARKPGSRSGAEELALIHASFERAGIPTSIAQSPANPGAVSDVGKMISALVRGALERAGLSEPEEPAANQPSQPSVGSR